MHLSLLTIHPVFVGTKEQQSRPGSVVHRKTYSTPIVQGNGGTHLFP